MPLLFSFFLIFLFLITGTGDGLFAGQLPAGSAEARGEWVARQADGRETGRDSRADIRMKLFDRQGRVRERSLTLLVLEGGPGRAAAGDRTLVRFTSPADISRTALLVSEQPDGDDERFLYLPSLGRVRRIAGTEAQESFVGSDFTYEDIGGRELEDYSYRLLDETATWTAPDGRTHPVYRLESRRRDASAKFPRVISLVRKDNLVLVEAQIFNRRDEVQKTYVAHRVQSVEGYWTVLEMRMTDELQRTRTELIVDAIDYDIGLTADDLSRRELER
jgi:hypothetical protein